MGRSHTGMLKAFDHWRLLPKVFLVALVIVTLATPFCAVAALDHEGRSSGYLTVCGDPNNLPFSNEQLEGFENRIAQLIADEIGRPLHYRWWPQTVGFVRNTLQVRLCDLIMGITSVNEMVQNTNPYYRSVYALVYRSDAPQQIQGLQDPALRNMRLGVVAGTPPATLLARYGLMAQTRSYQRTVDTRHFSPAAEAVADVANGELDLAILWGPIAGYTAAQQSVPLSVVPLPAEVDSVPLAFSVSMGIRHREKRWKHDLNEVLAKLKPEIEVILLEYGVPLLDANDRPVRP